MKSRRPPRVWAACAVTFLSGCAVWYDTQPHWREAIVQQVAGVNSEVAGSADGRCLAGHRPGSDEPVVIVKFRVGRAPYLLAVPVEAQTAVHVGDTVLVNPQLCRIKLAPA